MTENISASLVDSLWILKKFIEENGGYSSQYIIDITVETLNKLDSQVKSFESEISHLKHIIDRDRYIVAAGIGSVEKSCRGRQWTLEGRGPYEWDDDDYRKEFSTWIDEVRNSLNILRKVAWDKSDCENIESRVNAARQAAIEAVKAPLGPREMISADLGLRDHRDAEITSLKSQLDHANAIINELNRNTEFGYCEFCGHFGKIGPDGVHKSPNDQPCSFLIPKIKIKALTPAVKESLMNALVMWVSHLQPADPKKMMENLSKVAESDIINDIVQTTLEKGLITLNPDGYVVLIERSEK